MNVRDDGRKKRANAKEEERRLSICASFPSPPSILIVRDKKVEVEDLRLHAGQIHGCQYSINVKCEARRKR